MINFTHAFSLAWERMIVILFRPFNLGKWCTIGFSAFLAGLLAGGNGVSGSYGRSAHFDQNWRVNYNNQFHQQIFGPNGFVTALQTGATFLLVVVAVLFALAFVVLLYWLASRGQFLLLDNVVRNRGAIAWPWDTYAREGNSLFCFYLVFGLCAMVALLPLMIVAFVLGLPLLREQRWPIGGELGGWVLLGLAYGIILVVIWVVLFLFRELGVPLMFRNRLPAWTAFRETWNLVRRYPGTLILFVLLRIALFVALAIVSVIVCCVSCCGEMVPYIGTVLLLPALIYIKCFTLNFLAQFGPSYDVWTVDVPVSGSPSPSIDPGTGTTPPPPLG